MDSRKDYGTDGEKMWKAVMMSNDFGPVDKTPICERARSTDAVRRVLRKECLSYMEPRDMKRGKHVISYTVYFKPESGQWLKSGTVIGDTFYMKRGRAGVYWMPKDKENTDYIPRVINSDGSLGKPLYER